MCVCFCLRTGDWWILVLLSVGDGAEGVGGGRGKSGVWPVTEHFLSGCGHRSGSSHW